MIFFRKGEEEHRKDETCRKYATKGEIVLPE